MTSVLEGSDKKEGGKSLQLYSSAYLWVDVLNIESMNFISERSGKEYGKCYLDSMLRGKRAFRLPKPFIHQFNIRVKQ